VMAWGVQYREELMLIFTLFEDLAVANLEWILVVAINCYRVPGA